MSERRSLTAEELIALVRATVRDTSERIDGLLFLVQQLRKQINAEGEADDRKHA